MHVDPVEGRQRVRKIEPTPLHTVSSHTRGGDYQATDRLLADFSDFLGILGVSSDNLGTVLISTRLLLGILVPDSLEK